MTMKVQLILMLVLLVSSVKGVPSYEKSHSGYIQRGINLVKKSILARISKENNEIVTRASCGLPTSSLSESDKQLCVTEHNYWREDAGVKSSADEAKMVWDQDLADLAQNLTDKCSFYHGDKHLCNGDLVGQNLAVTTAQNMPPSYFIERWYMERDYYNYTNGGCRITQSNRACGHYTQVVWHTSRKVGCAQTFCPVAEIDRDLNLTWTNAAIFACNYSPPGNYQGAKPYVAGEVCSKCDNLFSNNTYKCDNGLCVGCTLDDPDCLCIKEECANGEVFNPDTCSCQTCVAGKCGVVCEKADANTPQGANCGAYKSAGYCAAGNMYYNFMQRDCFCTCHGSATG